jgi:galactokinase
VSELTRALSLAEECSAFEAFARHPEREFTELSGFFEQGRPRVAARAPGRLDVMGGIADYSGALVLEMPIREAAHVAVAEHSERVVRVASVNRAQHSLRMASVDLDRLLGDSASSYEAVAALFRENPTESWAAYVSGALWLLVRERGLRPAAGYRILVASDVPEGKGVSSSAAIEVSTMRALAALSGIELGPAELATLCQTLENRVVGAPCGIMDQMTAACGEAGRLLELLCQPAEVLGLRDIPSGVGLFGIDSGVRHAVTGADYGDVRCAAFMGYRMIAAQMGFGCNEDTTGQLSVDDPLWGGYLANIGPARFAAEFRANLPEQLSGREFLELYWGTTDRVTRVDPNREYPVRAATEHPVYEHFRTCAFSELIGHELHERRLLQLGELMYESHASYSACGLGCAATDELVRLVRRAGPDAGVYGAKITGGGSGGTVAVLGRTSSAARVREIAAEYARSTGLMPHVFAGSSPGAAALGVRYIDERST